jgi:hypothetical protein
VGLTAALSARLAAIKQRQRGHDPGRVIRWAHASARARSWELHGASEWLTLDVDATLIAAHPDKEKVAGNDKGGFGFHPLQVYLDETREALGGLLRPGNGRFQHRRCADDHKAVIDRAPGQTPSEYVETLEILVRADSAGPTHGLVDYCREGNMRFSVGYELTEPVRAAPRSSQPPRPRGCLGCGIGPDGRERNNGEVMEVTTMVDLSAWGEGCRLIVRREGPHPRSVEVPVQTLRAQRGVVRDRDARARPARL